MATTAIPSPGALIATLSRSDRQRLPPPAAAQVAVAMPRPGLFIRLLLTVTVMLLALVCAGIVVVGLRSLELVGSIRNHERAVHAAPVMELPPEAVLLDRGLFARRLANHPAESGRLLAARARAVSAHEGGEAAALAWAEAERAGGLTTTDLLDAAALLVDLRRMDAAESLLRRLPWADLGSEERARIVDLRGRCLLLRRPSA